MHRFSVFLKLIVIAYGIAFTLLYQKWGFGWVSYLPALGFLIVFIHCCLYEQRIISELYKDKPNV